MRPERSLQANQYRPSSSRRWWYRRVSRRANLYSRKDFSPVSTCKMTTKWGSIVLLVKTGAGVYTSVMRCLVRVTEHRPKRQAGIKEAQAIVRKVDPLLRPVNESRQREAGRKTRQPEKCKVYARDGPYSNNPFILGLKSPFA